MQQLRERGIYTLPSGADFVVHTVFRGGYFLYTPANWEFFGPYSYESNGGGNIERDGQLTEWHIDDLGDTKRTARSRSRSGAAPALSS
jgi:hypothetical protein